MLQTLRENVAVKKVVLWLVVLGLMSGVGIGVTAVYEQLVTGKTGPGSMEGPWAMIVAGETITQTAFNNEIRNLARQYSAQGQASFPGFEKMIQAEAENNIKIRTLELQEAEKSGLTVSDQEVSDQITSMPQLQQDGRFIGSDRYKELLRRNEMDVTGFETQIRQDLLVNKWRTLVGAGAVVTDREVEEEFRKRSEKVRFDHVVIEPAKYQPTTLPTDAEVKTYYDAHPDKYNRGEGRRARYVLVDEKVIAAVADPTDAELRSAYEADRAKFTGSFESSRDEIRRQMVFQRQQAEIDRIAREIQSSSAGGALEAAAQKTGLPIQDTGIVRRDPDGLSRLGPEFIESLFSAPKDVAIGPVKMVGGSAVYVLSEVLPAHRASIAEARFELLTDINKEKAKDAALAAARRTIGQAGNDLQVVAKALGGSVKSGALVGHGEPLGDLGYEPAVEKAVFATEAGRIAEPQTTSKGNVVVLKVVERKASDPASIGAEREKIRADLRRGREFLIMNSILESALAKGGYQRNEEFFKAVDSSS